MKGNQLCITADNSDNSITLSDDLCRELHIKQGKIAHIFVFLIKETGEYAIQRVSSKFAKTAQCGQVSYNPKLKTTGFISLIPTVNYMFYTMMVSSNVEHFDIEKRKLSDNNGYIYVIRHDKGD